MTPTTAPKLRRLLQRRRSTAPGRAGRGGPPPAISGPPQRPRPPARVPRRVSGPALKFDAARWTRADRIAGIATIVLFICLFLPWFTISFGFGSGSVNGLWHGWMWLSLILSIVIIAYLVLRAGWDKLPSVTMSRTSR